MVSTVSGSGWHIHSSPGRFKQSIKYRAVGVLWREPMQRLLLGALLMEEFTFFSLVQIQPSSNSLLLYVGLFWLLQANTLALAIMWLVLASCLSPAVVHMQNPLLFCCQDDSLFFKLQLSYTMQSNPQHEAHTYLLPVLFLTAFLKHQLYWTLARVPSPGRLTHVSLSLNPALHPIVVRSILTCAFS